MDAQILKKATLWASSPDFDQETRNEIASLIAKNDTEALTDRFYRDLTFGTGGMRGVMGAGSCRMNVYNINRATSAFALHLKKCHSKKPLKIAISYDSRINSQLYARTAAARLAAHGIKVLITKEMRPVPMLSYMVRHFNCDGGICITASHNPPSYNGYKVFWNDGGQLTPPHDDDVVKQYESLGYDFKIEPMTFAQAVTKDMVAEIGEELDEAYYKAVMPLALHQSTKKDLSIVYSPLHGTGIFAVPELLKRFGFTKIDIPPSQAKPDGNFPTVEFPNPEDPKALTLAIALARQTNADIVLATDPDTDRIGIIAKEKDDYYRLDGNQIICLLSEYMLDALKSQDRLKKHSYIVSTIVTTPLIEKIAAFYGIDCYKTLTGFKWIGQLIEELKHNASEKTFICGGEESFGFLPGDHVRDKDAVISCALAAEMTAYYKTKGQSLVDVLDSIYLRHGFHCDDLITITLEGEKGQRRIEEIMQTFRKNPPKKIADFNILSWIDYASSKKCAHNKPTIDLANKLPSSDVLEFELDHNIRFSIRPSGTEPKIKVYLSLSSKPSQTLQDLEQIKLELAKKKQDLSLAIKKALQ